jgi:hypothetical protein
MGILKSFIGRRQFLVAAGATSTLAVTCKKLAGVFAVGSMPREAIAADEPATDALEKRLARLEEANKRLEREVTLTRDIQEIQKLVGLMQHFHTGGRDAKVADYFAKKVPDVRVYFPGGGYWEGPDAPLKMAKLFDTGGGKPPVGMLAVHLMTNCVIEVAGDGKTAKGAWTAGGMVASRDEKTKTPSAMWEWNRYGTDFIKEDGQWRFWHHHIYPLFTIDWDEKWSEHFAKTEGSAAAGAAFPLETDGPPGPLDISYDPNGNLPYIPEPQPYETFDPNNRY